MSTNQSKLEQLLSKMFNLTYTTYERAVTNAKRLGHAQVGEAHLLLGVLAYGNADRTASVPRLLREAGGDYETLRTFLAKHIELRTGALVGKPPKASASLVRTLARANRIAVRRTSRTNGRGVIMTDDLMLALLNSREPLVVQAFEEMKVDKKALCAKFRASGTKPGASKSSLQLVN